MNGKICRECEEARQTLDEVYDLVARLDTWDTMLKEAILEKIAELLVPRHDASSGAAPDRLSAMRTQKP